MSLLEECRKPLSLRPQSKLHMNKTPRPETLDPEREIELKKQTVDTSDDEQTAPFIEEDLSQWDTFFNKKKFNSWADDTWTEEDDRRWIRGDFTDDEWDAWCKFGDGYWLQPEFYEEESPSIPDTEEEVPSLEIHTEGNAPEIYPSDEDELEEFLQQKLHGSENDSDDDDF